MKGEIEILLVEDNPADAELVMYSLVNARLASRIHVVHDGEEALEFIFCRGRYSNRSPDAHPRLVLLDIKLPKVGGLEVLRQIKSSGSTRTIPVVMLTSSGVERDIAEAYQNGANSFVQKPVEFDHLQSVVVSTGRYWLEVNAPPPFLAAEQGR